MLVDDLLKNTIYETDDNWNIIKRECSQFISESHSIPIYKTLSNTYSDLHKVKVRLQKKEDLVSGALDKAFMENTYSLSNRSVFAYPHIQPSNIRNESNLDLFYVFPINGYKFLYSKEVINATNDFKPVIDTLTQSFDNNNEAIEIVSDLLKYTYTGTNLTEGIISSAEIIFYNIPYYYAVRVSTELDYNQLTK